MAGIHLKKILFHMIGRKIRSVPEYFAFSRDKAEWTLRKSYVYCPMTESLVTTERSRAAKSHLLAIGRLYRTLVLDKELQALRTILMVRKGPRAVLR